MGINEDVENTVFVAVGKNLKETQLIISWVLKCFGGSGKKICLLHVHQPLHLVTLLDGKLSPSKLKQQAVKVCRELERQRLHKLLNQYLLILSKSKVQGDKLWIEMDNVEKGIVQTVARYGIKWLVMGAAAEKQYSREMSELKSNKAIYVCQHAPYSCHIWFTCKGCLTYTRERSADVNSDVGSILALPAPISATDTLFEHSQLTPLLMDSIEDKGLPVLSPHDSAGHLCSSSVMVLDENSQEQSSGNLHDKLDLAMIDVENSRAEAFQEAVKQWKAEEDAIDVLRLDEISQGQSSGNSHDKLDHVLKDAENARQEAFQEAVNRWKAEEDAIDALRIAEASESSWKKEATQRKEMEETLATQKQELEKMINQRDECMEELQIIREHNPVLETRIRKNHGLEKELEEKIIQAVNLLITFKERRDQLREDCDNAIVEINQLRRLVEKNSSSFCKAQFLAPSFFEIIGATQDFDPSMKIGEGRYGSVYKGILQHMKVAIKMLPSVGSQSDAEFKHEVEILSRVRHPNLVTLIGTCPESRSLIFEYLENGSLEDRLGQLVKTPPLPWKTRLNIAVEICSALIFLHSNKPPLTHGNLKLTNILLDKNFVSKLSDLGIHRLIPGCKTDEKASVYVGPEFIVTGELTVYTDIYSLGIVLLQILTGRPASGVFRDVKCAVENGNFSTILDSSAGDWPIKQVKQLADLALKCCEENPLDRPDLVSDVWAAIEPMRDLCTTTLHLESEGHRRVPSYFVCPIFQEVMKDPYIAADGFTYEADAIKGWLNSGHKTSPMTNLKLEHCDLLPNSALYYAIQEWMQQP